jgi:hypothetical protein
MAKVILPMVVSSVSPVVTDDKDHGNFVGQFWFDSALKKLFQCHAAATGAAEWVEVGSGAGGGGNAEDIVFDPAASGMTATDVQAAIEEVKVDADAAATAADNAADDLAALDASLGDAATKNVGTTAGTVAAGNDSRFTDARTPTAHQASHAANGSDALPWTTIHGRGATGDRPAAAASNAGYLYYNTSTSTLQRSDGTTWHNIGEAGGGGGSADPSDVSLNLGLQFLGL